MVPASNWCPRQMPNTGTSPRRAPIWVRTSARGPGSPGPLERNTPSGSMARTSNADVDAGTIVTSPSPARCRMMVALMPKSKATMRRPPPVEATVVGASHVTVDTRSRPSVPGSTVAAAASVARSAVPKAPGMAPASRRWRVRRRVSIPAIPGTPWVRSSPSRSSSARQLLRRLARSRTTTPRQNGRRLSLSSGLTP